MVKILILIGGGERPLKPFLEAGKKLGQKIDGASFKHLEFRTDQPKITVKGQDLAAYDLVYLRVVGRRFEDAALVVQYAREKKVALVDQIYAEQGFIRLPLAKSLEARLLSQARLPLPLTYFGTLKQISQKAPRLFGFPFVIKGTTGKQGHAVWSPRNSGELQNLLTILKPKEKKGGRFVAQEFIRSGQRHRHLVIGGQVVGAITRPTRWRKRFLGSKAAPGKREAIKPIPEKEKILALKACQALGIEIGGVDLLKEEQSNKLFVIEVNSAPRWASIKKDTGVRVEKKIIKYLIKKAQIHSSLSAR